MLQYDAAAFFSLITLRHILHIQIESFLKFSSFLQPPHKKFEMNFTPQKNLLNGDSLLYRFK